MSKDHVVSVEQIEKAVLQVFSDQLDLSQKKIKPESRIRSDLGGDSLDLIEIVIALEDEFEIEIPDQNTERFDTVQSVIDCIVKILLAKK